MATNPQREDSQRLGWPGKGKIMTEDAYHELERLSPDRSRVVFTAITLALLATFL